MSEAPSVICFPPTVTAGMDEVSAHTRVVGIAAVTAARECTKCLRLRIMRAPGVLVRQQNYAIAVTAGSRLIWTFVARGQGGWRGRRRGPSTLAKTTLFASRMSWLRALTPRKLPR